MNISAISELMTSADSSLIGILIAVIITLVGLWFRSWNRRVSKAERDIGNVVVKYEDDVKNAVGEMKNFKEDILKEMWGYRKDGDCLNTVNFIKDELKNMQRSVEKVHLRLDEVIKDHNRS